MTTGSAIVVCLLALRAVRSPSVAAGCPAVDDRAGRDASDLTRPADQEYSRRAARAGRRAWRPGALGRRALEQRAGSSRSRAVSAQAGGDARGPAAAQDRAAAGALAGATRTVAAGAPALARTLRALAAAAGRALVRAERVLEFDDRLLVLVGLGCLLAFLVLAALGQGLFAYDETGGTTVTWAGANLTVVASLLAIALSVFFIVVQLFIQNFTPRVGELIMEIGVFRAAVAAGGLAMVLNLVIMLNARAIASHTHFLNFTILETTFAIVALFALLLRVRRLINPRAVIEDLVRSVTLDDLLASARVRRQLPDVESGPPGRPARAPR